LSPSFAACLKHYHQLRTGFGQRHCFHYLTVVNLGRNWAICLPPSLIWAGLEENQKLANKIPFIKANVSKSSPLCADNLAFLPIYQLLAASVRASFSLHPSISNTEVFRHPSA
jgi:hypothetical protein